MTATFTPNPAGIAAALSSPRAVEFMHTRVGEQIETEAVRNSPVQTGRYVNAWYVQSGVRDGAAWVRVGNSARSNEGYNYPLALEYGNSLIRRQRILGRALDAVNLA